MNRKVIIPLLILLAAGAVGYFYVYLPNIPATEPIVSDKDVFEAGTFDDCVKEGNPIQESYPPLCRTKSGKMLTQNIGNEILLKDMILITSPRPTQKVTSPLIIKGKARGGWFFEGQFNASLLNETGEVIGEGVIKSDGEWTTEEFVPFTGELVYDSANSTGGRLILEKANPSGIVKSDSQLIVPLKFK